VSDRLLGPDHAHPSPTPPSSQRAGQRPARYHPRAVQSRAGEGQHGPGAPRAARRDRSAVPASAGTERQMPARHHGSSCGARLGGEGDRSPRRARGRFTGVGTGCGGNRSQAEAGTPLTTGRQSPRALTSATAASASLGVQLNRVPSSSCPAVIPSCVCGSGDKLPSTASAGSTVIPAHAEG
jgi:hypothetical protein